VSVPGSERPAERVPSPSTGRSPSDTVAPEDAGVSAAELEVLLRVRDLLRRLEFGSVLIVVHEGRVVQIEMAEKIRLR
jgi:hypothetical protein